MTKNYNVPTPFELNDFLAECRANGLKLAALDDQEQVHGNISMGGGVLTVNIAEDVSGREEPSGLSPEAAVAVADAAVASRV